MRITSLTLETITESATGAVEFGFAPKRRLHRHHPVLVDGQVARKPERDPAAGRHPALLR